MPEALAVRALRVTAHVEGPALQVGNGGRGHLRGVPEQLPLRDRTLSTPFREQDLVEVGEPQRTAEHLPGPLVAQRVERRERLLTRPCVTRRPEVDGGLRGREVGAPQSVGVGTDLLVRPPAEHRPRVLVGVPPLHGVLVALVHQQPLLPVRRASAPHQREPAAQLLPVHVDVQLARLDRGPWVVGVVRLPRPGVPDSHVAGAVLPSGDHALEVDVLHRVVLHAKGAAPPLRVEGRPLGHRPADQDPVDLEPEVVVRAPRPVTLDDEPPGCPAAPAAPCLAQGRSIR